jgi:hypothetical protein
VGVFMLLWVFLLLSMSLSFLVVVSVCRLLVLAAEPAYDQRSDAARRGCARCDPGHGCHTHRTHGSLSFCSTFTAALLPSLSFGPLLDVTQLVRPVPLERLHPVMDWLQFGRIQFVHAVLSALNHRYHADFAQHSEVLRHGGLRHPQSQYYLANRILPAICQHTNQLTPPGLRDSVENIRRCCRSSHSFNICRYRHVSSRVFKFEV